ncbi:hypothetical protein FRX31_002251, partial [Thalictrum thalictroides]
MTVHDSNKHAPSASHSGRSAVHPNHTDCRQNIQTRSSSSGRSSLSPAHLATVRSQARLWYRMRRARLADHGSIQTPNPIVATVHNSRTCLYHKLNRNSGCN